MNILRYSIIELFEGAPGQEIELILPQTQNAAKIPGAHEIHLETVAIGNGWYDPLIQYQAYYNYTVYPGNTYDYRPFNASTSAQMYNSLYGTGNCVDRTLDCYATGINEVCSTADTLCAKQVESILDNVANRDEYVSCTKPSSRKTRTEMRC